MSNWTSNAFNFDSYCSGGVDQRTRNYSYQILLGSLIGNWLKGPHLDIALQFFPYLTENLGFGKGWKLNIPRYNITDKQLYLANGQSYHAELGANYKIDIRYKKLLDYSVNGNSNGFEITYRDGRKDILDDHGYLIKIVQSDGHALYFSWLNTGSEKRLDKVWDDRTSKNQPLLHIEYPTPSNVNISTNIGNTHESHFSLTLTNERLIKCNLPENVGGYNFGYKVIGVYTLIENITHPCGMREEILYDANGIKVNSNTYLPAVTSHRVLTQNSPIIKTEYGSVDSDSRNFMGYSAQGGSLAEGVDNLLERGNEYIYRVQKLENGGAVKTVQTYNQFHLLMEEFRYVNEKIVYHKMLRYPARDNVDFSSQPAQYALISQEDQTWLSGEHSHLQTRYWEYDQYGNMLTFKDENNITEYYEYYSLTGEPGCPVSPSGMVNFVKSRTLSNGIETRKISYEYREIEGFNNQKNVVLHSETAHNRYQSHYSYHEDKDEAFSLGRLASIKNDLIHADGTYSKASSYQYALTSDTVEEHEELMCHDGTNTNVVVAHYFDIGEISHHVDVDGIRCSFEYDSLRRITTERIDDSAERLYQYRVDTTLARQIMVLTDCKGNLCEQSWDGQGRELEAKLGEITVWKKEYDARGRLNSKSIFDILPDKDASSISVTQTETYEYDDWDQVKATTLPNGNRYISFNNLASRQKTQGIEGLALTVSDLNNWGLETKKQQGNRIWSYEYDAWGRLKNEIDPAGQFQSYQYDKFDRAINIMQTNNVAQKITYAVHTDQTQVTKLQIGSQTVGLREIDGLGRPIALFRGASNQASLAWMYTDSSNVPETETSLATPARRFTRDSQLGVLNKKESGEQITTYQYDLISGLQTGSKYNDEHSSTITYSSTGLPVAEQYNGNIRQYSYSNGGVITSVKDKQGLRHFSYDALGRLVKLSTSKAAIEYEYDQFDRITLERLTSGNQTQITDIEWDEYSREVSRTVALNDTYIFEQYQDYNELGLLRSRIKEGATLGKVTETYTYDSLSQLKRVEFLGDGPLSEWGQPIVSLEWSYDDLGNMLSQRCTTNESQDVANYYYEAEDPTQLTRITHTHPQLPNQTVLKYDLNGNIIQDVDGRELSYDNFDKLTRVLSGNTEWQYSYDSNDRLTRQYSDSESRYFEYLWSDLASIAENGNVTHYIYDDGVPKWSEQGSVVSIQATDQNGSVIASNTSGQTTSFYRYAPYGQCEQVGNTNEQ
ncbi:sugar-binding protein [Aeromonas sobria]|uniref:Sugar-binding protein n=1 Tax=Aeromonas sobria TaxID=646 RepID=A0A2N3IX57_AERSO|nr:RHS repeat protein [Aeromonas sobria]PKQ75539.1 sugar-binding protein [Aeromonas sobria]PKQ77296.1 sugar-binding protein [Aeromonas sobria]